MNNKENDNNHEELIESIYLDGRSILTRKTPVALIKQFFNGSISRIDAWHILRLIHDGKEKCGLPQYGMLTVYSLSKDNDEFTRLYDQGVKLLLDNNLVNEESLDSDYEIEKLKNKKPKNKNINPRFN